MSRDHAPGAGWPNLETLLATWQQWNRRDLMAQAARRAEASGDTHRATALRAILGTGSGGPPAAEALAAQHELVARLQDWQWHTVTAAREQGSSWADIAAATATTAEAARADYAAHLERADQAATADGHAFDHDRYHAALADTSDEEFVMTDQTDNDTSAAAAYDEIAAELGWPASIPTSPPEQLTDRELLEHPADEPTVRWAVARHEAHLDRRSDESTPNNPPNNAANNSAYRPAAEYGDPDWREPASDDEAAARLAWLEQNTALAPGWVPRPRTELDHALDEAREQAVLSDRAHDHDPLAWAEYQRLHALSELAPLPDEPDALDRHQAEETAPGGEDGPYVDDEDRSWPSVDAWEDAWETARADPAKATDTSHPDDLPRLRRRLADLQTRHGAVADGEQEFEQRREQLTRWHQDDHRTTDTATTIDATGSDDTDTNTDAGGAGEER